MFMTLYTNIARRMVVFIVVFLQLWDGLKVEHECRMSYKCLPPAPLLQYTVVATCRTAIVFWSWPNRPISSEVKKVISFVEIVAENY